MSQSDDSAGLFSVEHVRFVAYIAAGKYWWCYLEKEPDSPVHSEDYVELLTIYVNIF